MIPPHLLTNFEIKEDYYQNEPRFNGAYSINKLPKTIKDGTYVVNLDNMWDVGTHWIVLYIKNIEIICFDSFGAEHVSKEIKKIIKGTIGHKK